MGDPHANGNGVALEPETDPTMTLELAVIQRAVCERADVPALASMLDPEHFHFEAHRRAWELIVRAGDEPLDSVALHMALEPHVGFDQAFSTAHGTEAAEVLALGKRPTLLARMVRGQAARRARGKLAERLRDSASTEDAAEMLEGIAELERDPAATHPILARSRTGAELLTAELAAVPSLAGGGLLVRGGLFILAGHSGLGKTFLALQLMHSLASGIEFLGFKCERLRVGLIELEMPEATIRDRLRGLLNGHSEWLDNVRFLAIPDQIVNVLQSEHRKWIADWCLREQLDVVLIDPLNALHNLDDDKTMEAGKVMRAVREIRGKTGTCIGLVHHVRKSQAGHQVEGARTKVLEDVRGSGRLGNDPDTVFGMVEGPTGFTKLVFAKTRYVETPEELYLRRDEAGYFHVTEAPSEKAGKNRDKIAKRLMLSPATVEQLAETIGLDPSTVSKHLKKMAGVSVVDGSWPYEYQWDGPIQRADQT